MTYSHRQIGWLTGGLPLVMAFGIGLIRKRVLMSEIRSARVVRTPWWAGWGIRLVAGGWLYNVEGRKALELNYVGGGRILVGTDDPAGLMAALRAQGVRDADTEFAGMADTYPGYLRWAPLVILVSLAFVVMLVMYIGSRPPTVAVSGDVITIQHGRDVVSVARQTAIISLETTLPAIGRKHSGFNLGDTLRGRYRLLDGTSVHLFVTRDVPPFIRIQHGERIVFVNFDDPERTRQVYESLR